MNSYHLSEGFFTFFSINTNITQWKLNLQRSETENELCLGEHKAVTIKTKIIKEWMNK